MWILAAGLALALAAPGAPEVTRPLALAAPGTDATASSTLARAPDDRALRRLRLRIGWSREARIATAGARYTLEGVRVAGDGIHFDSVRNSGGAAPPNPVPWAQVDTLWRPRNKAGTGAVLLGTVACVTLAVTADRTVSPGPPWGLLAQISGGMLGLVGGGLAGAAIGAQVQSWEVLYPMKPVPEPDSGRSIFK